MKNTLENKMLDAAISWCDSNGINVLEPEQLASLVNSLYITVRDAAPANLVLVPLRPTRAMEAIFQQEDWQWADVLAAAESVTDEQYLFALEDDKQAQPERAPLSDKQDRALCEAYYDTASDEYFKVRPQLESDLNRRIFYAGHRYAWINYETAHGIKQGGQ